VLAFVSREKHGDSIVWEYRWHISALAAAACVWVMYGMVGVTRVVDQIPMAADCCLSVQRERAGRPRV